jgi:hypothetical protein
MRAVALLIGAAFLGCEANFTLQGPRQSVGPPAGAPSSPGMVNVGTPGPANAVDAGPVIPDFPPYAPGLLRPRALLSSWYRNSIEQVFGDAAARAVTLSPDLTEGGLVAIGAGGKSFTATDITRLEENAFAAARAALASATDRARLISCTPASASDAACMRTVVTATGRRLFRRPMTSEEETRWVNVGQQAAAATNDFRRGVEFALAGLLQSPAFLYLDEQGVPEAATGWHRLTSYEMAARLAFFVTQAGPDDVLLQEAANDRLQTPTQIAEQTNRLLGTLEARETVSSLYDEVLDLEGLANTQKSDPTFNRDVAASMRNEIRLLAAHVALDGQQDFRSLLTTRTGYVDARLAPLYGLPAPAAGVQRVELPATRPGMLTRLGHLTNKAHDVDTSPTHRGKLIRQRLLCMGVGRGPADVVAMVPPPDMNNRRTFRQRLEDRTSGERCQGCHQLMDPFGFPFEAFDSLGRPRTTDNGLPVDSTGTYDIIFGRTERYQGAADFATLLAADERMTECTVATLFRQATGRLDVPSEGSALYHLHAQWRSQGFQYGALIVAITTSEAFRTGKKE